MKLVQIATLIIGLLFATSIQAQFTKNIKEYTTELGIHIEPGMKIKILKGTHPSIEGQHLWSFYSKKKMPVPDQHFSNPNEGKEYVIEKVLKMKGLKNPEDSTIILFKDGKKKCYSFIAKALLTNEVEIINELTTN